jgi:hypothetical protein
LYRRFTQNRRQQRNREYDKKAERKNKNGRVQMTGSRIYRDANQQTNADQCGKQTHDPDFSHNPILSINMRSALVTGASRGVGRDVAISLAGSGFKVFATGRTIDRASLPEGIVRLTCDHTSDDQTDQVFHRIADEAGQLDVLVNNAWASYERMVEDGVFKWPLPFRE